jgi:hypothetical protein
MPAGAIELTDCAGMLRDRGGPIDIYVPPKSRPLLEQVELAQRVAIARTGLSMNWEEIAGAEGIPKRTLQHFYKSWLDGLKAPRAGRRNVLERYVEDSLD